MYTLSEQQIDFILCDIKSRGVEMEDLQTDLLDHICCIIESELEPDGDFESFYRKTIPRFFKKELREIEEETILLLTFKNYYTMRKVMIMTGAISVAGFIVGSFLKIMHWPGANILLFSAIITASLLFMPLLFLLKTREAKSMMDKVVLSIGTVFGIVISFATMFKIMHWPHANVMWLISLGILFFLFIPLYFFSGIRNPETKVNTITSSMLVLFAGGLLFTLTSLRPSKQLVVSTMCAYVQNEDLLERMRIGVSDSVKADALYSQINEDCEKIKGLILQDEIGMKKIPVKYDALDESMSFTEGGLGDAFMDNGNGESEEGAKLFSDLKTAVEKYNASRAVNIPIKNSVLDLEPNKLQLLTNFYVLNSMVRIQMFLASAEK